MKLLLAKLAKLPIYIRETGKRVRDDTEADFAEHMHFDYQSKYHNLSYNSGVVISFECKYLKGYGLLPVSSITCKFYTDILRKMIVTFLRKRII